MSGFLKTGAGRSMYQEVHLKLTISQEVSILYDARLLTRIFDRIIRVQR